MGTLRDREAGSGVIVPGQVDHGDPVERALPSLYALPPSNVFPNAVLSVVRHVVGGDKAHYTEVNLKTKDFRVLVAPEPDELNGLHEARVAYMSDHPVMRHCAMTNDLSPRLLSDFLSPTAYHRLPLYGEFFRPLRVEDQLTVVITGRGSDRMAGVTVDRDNRSFSESERALFARLQPHLAAAHDNALAFSHALTTPSTYGSAGALTERLSERQREILSCVARGHTNIQIGLALDISPGTVRKHIENILARLGLPNRTAAAALYLAGRDPSEDVSWTAVEATLYPFPASSRSANARPWAAEPGVAG